MKDKADLSPARTGPRYVAAGREKCCGCFACCSICPHGAIEMKEDEEGFVYALKNDACVDCGLCLTVCPFALAENMAK